MERTWRIRHGLPTLWERLGVISILDVPCGDHGWMSTMDLSGYQYIGVDIVPDLIANNRARHPDRRFEVADVCAGPLPDADFVLSRDLLVHLSFADIEAALKNLLAVQGRYLMCTTFPDIRNNEDIVTGKHRRLNMCEPPFGWPQPLELLEEGTESEQIHGKCQGVWSLVDLRAHWSSSAGI